MFNIFNNRSSHILLGGLSKVCLILDFLIRHHEVVLLKLQQAQAYRMIISFCLIFLITYARNFAK